MDFCFISVGPFLIYEYCSNGQMRDHLEKMKTNATVETQKQQIRLGIGVARGMDYLAQKGVSFYR